MSEISVIESECVVLAKMAPGLANLSKIVKSSNFISISSETVSIIKSASRDASSIKFAPLRFASAESRTSELIFPRAASSLMAHEIQAIPRSNATGEISSRIVRYPVRAAVYAILHPKSVVPTIAMVLISTVFPNRSFEANAKPAVFSLRAVAFYFRSFL